MYPFSKCADNISWQQKLPRCFIKYICTILHNFPISIGNAVLQLWSCGEYDHSYDEVEQSRSHKLGSFCRCYMVNFQNKSLEFVAIINTEI